MLVPVVLVLVALVPFGMEVPKEVQTMRLEGRMPLAAPVLVVAVVRLPARAP